MSTTLIVFLSLTELALLGVLLVFFWRLRKSEALLSELQARQEEFVRKLQFNAKLEDELMQTFARRQTELAKLDTELEEQCKRLNKLLDQAKGLCRSPQFLRQLVVAGHKEGKSAKALAQATGLPVEDVELIIDQIGT